MNELVHKIFNLPYSLNNYKFGDWSKSDDPVLILVHGIGVSHKIWQDVIKKLPQSVPILAVDLLGFGHSPKPSNLQYNLNDHSRSLHKTIRRQVGSRKIVICGHSLGSLIAIKYASLYPKKVSRLILCSPPIYDFLDKDNLPKPEEILKNIGKRFTKAIEKSQKVAKLANGYKISQKNFNINPYDIDPYAKTIKNSILKQESLDEVMTIDNIPIDIFYGSLDGVMIPKNLKLIYENKPLSSIEVVVSGHEIRKNYATILAKKITDIYSQK